VIETHLTEFYSNPSHTSVFKEVTFNNFLKKTLIFKTNFKSKDHGYKNIENQKEKKHA